LPGGGIRVFIAVDIEDPLLLSRLERLKESIMATGVPMKPVETQNLHITLRFIGEVPLGTVEEIAGLLRRIRYPRFRIHLKGLGAFPSISRPRVIWVGVEEGGEDLARLHDIIEKELATIGIPPERQKFHPHVTLARLKGARGISSLIRLLQELADTEVGEVEVQSIRLKKSTLTRSGPIYETLMEVKLD
jgi:2'-5' RNA ligase